MEQQEGQPIQPEPTPTPSSLPMPAASPSVGSGFVSTTASQSKRQLGGFAPHPADLADEPMVSSTAPVAGAIQQPASDSEVIAPPAPSEAETVDIETLPPAPSADERADEEETADDQLLDSQSDEPVDGTEVISPDRSYSWHASEYIYHPKSAMWYFALIGGTALIDGLAIFFHQYTAALVVTVMALAIALISRKQPRTLQYVLDGDGIDVGGRSFDYAAFSSYSVFQDVGWRTIDLIPRRRLVPNLSIICENDTFDSIESILSEYLPRHDRKPDWVERLSRYLHF